MLKVCMFSVLINKTNMTTLYGQLFFLGLVVKLTSFSFYFKGNSSLTLLYQLKSTAKTPSMPKTINQPSGQNIEIHSYNKMKVVVVGGD